MRSTRIEPGSWTDRASRHIETVIAGQPDDASFEEKIKSIDQSYPFMMRQGWAYKAWLKARRDWINRNDPKASERLREKLSKLVGQRDLLWP